ncbi:hypothetical protein AVEN_30330-1, partial [Araneus ventricosus]
DQDNPEESEEEEVSANLLYHADAASGHELAIFYVEQHVSPTLTDVIPMRLWRKLAAPSEAGLAPYIKRR